MQQGHKAVRNPPPLGVGRFKEISQEVIEAACRAFFNNDSNPDWEKLGERVRRMLAALEVAAPLINERSAEIELAARDLLEHGVIDWQEPIAVRVQRENSLRIALGMPLKPLPQPPKETK